METSLSPDRVCSLRGTYSKDPVIGTKTICRLIVRVSGRQKVAHRDILRWRANLLAIGGETDAAFVESRRWVYRYTA